MLVVLCVAVLLLAVPADASRDLPITIKPSLEVPVVGPSDLDLKAPVRRSLPFFSIADVEAFSAGRTHRYDDPSGRFCIYDGPRRPSSLPRGEGFIHPDSFQGLWTDPVTGIAYARNRWYDARTASWLSEDRFGAIDSPDLYAFVGWQPHAATDPMGTCLLFGIPIGDDHESNCLSVWGRDVREGLPFLGQELKGEADFVQGFGEGVYESPDVFAERTIAATQGAAGAIKEFALNPAVLPETMMSGLRGTVNAAYTLSHADSDVLVMVVADAAADEWRRLAAKGPREIGRMVGRETPILVVSAVAGEVLFASRGLAAGDEVLGAAKDFQRFVNNEAKSAANRLRLQKQLASEGQVGELFSGGGESIAGAGARVPIRDIDRLVSQYGGVSGDWAKVSSSSFRAADGTSFQVHAYRHIHTGELVELKTKLQ